MRRGGAIPDADGTLKPTFELRMCVTCGLRARWKFDRRGRPYHFCPHCGLRVFIYNLRALSGFRVMHDMMVRAGPQRLRVMVNRLVERRLSALSSIRA